tara:strand:+ start:61 stop:525 length:465 start_codon:yes stop_codon:yes gene_type:complete
MTVIVGTDSYIAESDLIAYAAKRGVTLISDASVLLIKAMDYLEAQSFKGTKTDPSQPLQWPRVGVSIDGAPIDSATVPAQVGNAQAVIALSIDSGFNPLDTYGPAVKREKVDVIEVEYQDNSGATDYSPAITSALRPIVSSGFNSVFIPVSAAR